MAMGLLGALFAPGLSATYWLDGLFLRSSRVTASTGPGFAGNQSLRGVAARTLGESTGATAAWAVAAAGITRMWSVSLCVRKSVCSDGKTEYNYMLTLTRRHGRAAVLDSKLGRCT